MVGVDEDDDDVSCEEECTCVLVGGAEATLPTTLVGVGVAEVVVEVVEVVEVVVVRGLQRLLLDRF